ncbi:hypothetical protein K432DRAFT_381931 [Lepidopterella palustris CBS 459.81]|uniref:Uncharacterized protein n=1 Tax=Lepidopterella palustris CBS 459.81 TaxID=1314670 RepID=A0A8E2EBH7_9PEZI|nr:hypothetical protein K432DRAFT_381931 [Lepidopterella palustris CBS 459.81]
MSTLDVLGVVGTWVAVLLAVIALAGILPAYLLYQRSRTDRYLAFDEIDDKYGTSLSRGYELLPGKRFFRKEFFLECTKAPDFNQIEIRRDLTFFLRKDAYSLTGWVNFANILRFYKANLSSNGKIHVVQQEALLPVHRGWLLLLGLVDRYCSRESRPDLGLLIDEAKTDDMDAAGPMAIYGLSGIVDHVSRSVQSSFDDESPREAPVERVRFRMHSADHMATLGTKFPKDDISVATLFFLYLGYVPGANQSLYFLQVPKQSDVWVTENPRNEEERKEDIHLVWSLQRIEDHQIPLHHKRLAREVGVKFGIINRLHVDFVGELVDSTRQKELQNCLISKEPTAERYFLVKSERNKRSWMHRSDLHCILFSLLRLRCCSQSFLFGLDLSDGNSLFRRIFNSGWLVQSITRAVAVFTDFDLQGEKEEALRMAMSKTLERASDGENRSRWSRRLMERCVELDNLLDQCFPCSSPAMQAISILYMLEKPFRRYFNKTDAAADAVRKLDILLKPNAEQICLPSINETVGGKNFFFDFRRVFSGPGFDGNTIKEQLPYSQAIIACLKGHLRMAMWDMVLPAKPFSRMYTKLPSVFHMDTQQLLSEEISDTSDSSSDLRPQEPVIVQGEVMTIEETWESDGEGHQVLSRPNAIDIDASSESGSASRSESSAPSISSRRNLHHTS